MPRSQPLNSEKWGISDDDNQMLKDKTVIKTEIVDSMFDIYSSKVTIFNKIRWFPHHIKDKYNDIKWSVKNIFIWSKVIGKHRPWDIHCFLPMFVKHLEMYIDTENRFGTAIDECKEYRVSTAKEALDIVKRLLDDDYSSLYTNAVDKKWGKFKYEKTTYSNGSVGYKHLTPDEYDIETSLAYNKAREDEERDLKRLGKIIESDMINWWD